MSCKTLYPKLCSSSVFVKIPTLYQSSVVGITPAEWRGEIFRYFVKFWRRHRWEASISEGGRGRTDGKSRRAKTTFVWWTPPPCLYREASRANTKKNERMETWTKATGNYRLPRMDIPWAGINRIGIAKGIATLVVPLSYLLSNVYCLGVKVLSR